jgi:hypothetical protein
VYIYTPPHIYIGRYIFELIHIDMYAPIDIYILDL